MANEGELYLDFYYRFIAKQEGNWAELDVATVAILEIFLPNETIAIRKLIAEDPNSSNQDVPGYQTFVLEPSVESLTKLLSITVDHIDTLLEDWYPVLGKLVSFSSVAEESPRIPVSLTTWKREKSHEIGSSPKSPSDKKNEWEWVLRNHFHYINY